MSADERALIRRLARPENDDDDYAAACADAEAVLAAYDATAGDPFAAVRTLPEWDELEDVADAFGSGDGFSRDLLAAAAEVWPVDPPCTVCRATSDESCRRYDEGDPECPFVGPSEEGTTPR